MTDKKSIRIGTRGSELALWQARWVQRALLALHPGLEVMLVIIKTSGDRAARTSTSGGTDAGLFTREIERALLKDEIDVAVHSLKDLPTVLPRGLRLGAITERGDVRDVFIPHPRNSQRSLFGQSPGAIVATGSLRRKSQILHRRPDLAIAEIRGNLNTRIRRLEASPWAGMILARAGVVRLGWESLVGETIDPEFILPAAGQGALAVEIRDEDARVAPLVAPLMHEATRLGTTAERTLLQSLEGGCQIPIGAWGRIIERGGENGAILRLDAVVGSLDGKSLVRGTEEGEPRAAEEIGERLAAQLLERGAAAILREIRLASSDV